MSPTDQPGPAGPAASGTGTAARIGAWLHAHHGQMVTVTDLAVAMGLSVRRVQAICRAHYGQSPTGLLRGIRLDNARTRLLAGELAAGRAIVAAVAAAAGFSRPARFTAPTGTGSVRLPPRPSNAPAPDRP